MVWTGPEGFQNKEEPEEGDGKRSQYGLKIKYKIWFI